ncbi:DMT family transporter [Patescibacteria group bacterium]|nr:DMT family transporter [Patescibacteria group bacterium]MBU1931681.1 DMT family transporter [Patescibacteria group bacterium]
MTIRIKAYLALITTAIIWGISPPIIKYTLNFISPTDFLFWRFLLVSILILPVFLKKIKVQPFELCDLPQILLVAFCSTSLTLGLLFFGLNKTSSVDAAVLAATVPIMIVLGGVVFLKEVITRQEKIGLALAFGGTLIAVLSPLLKSSGTFTTQNLLGNILILVSNISWATYTLLGKNLAKKYSSFNLTAMAFFVGLITYIPLFLLSSSYRITMNFLPNIQAIPGILFMSLFASIIAYFTYAYGVSLIEASEATLFTYLQPIFTIPLAVFWLGETVDPSFIMGAIFIVIGVFLTEYKKQSVKSEQRSSN